MKRHWLLIGILLLIAAYAAYSAGNITLKSQLVTEQTEPMKEASVSSCEQFSEPVANDCFLRQALQEKDSSWCGKISKPSLVSDCRRELELLP